MATLSRTVPLLKCVASVALVTQEGVEVVYQGSPSARVTQLGLEVLIRNQSQARVTQLGIEVIIPKGGGIRTVPLSFLGRFRRSRTAPIFGDFLKTSTRTVPLSAQTFIGRRFVPLTFRPVIHPQHAVPLGARLQQFGRVRTVPLATKLGLLGQTRTVPLLTFTSGVGPPWTRSQTVRLRAQLVKLGAARTIPLTVAPMGRRSSRTVPLAVVFGLRHPRTVPLSTRVRTHPFRLIRLSANISGRHVIPLTARLKRSGFTRTVPFTGRTKRTSTRTVAFTGRTKRFGAPRSVPLMGNTTHLVAFVRPTSTLQPILLTTTLELTTTDTAHQDMVRLSQGAAVTLAAVGFTQSVALSQTASVAASVATSTSSTLTDAARKSSEDAMVASEVVTGIKVTTSDTLALSEVVNSHATDSMSLSQVASKTDADAGTLSDVASQALGDTVAITDTALVSSATGTTDATSALSDGDAVVT